MRTPVSALILGVVFIVAGALHFVSPAPYVAMVPPYLPWPEAMVAVSGLAEILGGTSVLIPRFRFAAGIGLIALLVAVFPANIHLALHPEVWPQVHIPAWAMWGRLPLQAVMIYAVWRVCRRKPDPTA